MNDNQRNPFSLLPEALVEEMLAKSQEVGKALLSNVREVNIHKDSYRKKLTDSGLLKHISDLPHVSPPTTVGVDGAQIVDRLLATDLVACAAVAIEGLTPPAETRYWDKPFHKVYIHPQPHHNDTGTVIRGIMWELEIILAATAPHDVVFMDGSITNPFLNLNAALNKINEFPPSNLIDELERNFPIFLNAYHDITTSTRTDKLWVGVPKYTSKREIGETQDWPKNYDDRAILTSLLRPGEYIIPVPYDQPLEPWHINMSQLTNKTDEMEAKLSEIIVKINDLHVCYFRPHPYTPALRLEVPKSLTTNRYQLSTLLHALSYQCGTPGIIEPYPLFMADRMVKNISTAVPAFRQTATLEMAHGFEADLAEIFFTMHAYRTV
ncbi:MAG: DNA double-strand break repair nuclease NurA [Cyclobacteriaceae bacterium]|jgi:hypothetical protein|nr:DNA double-strand break repair nuclease NurA [Cyclobacteriaceae bacterium]